MPSRYIPAVTIFIVLIGTTIYFYISESSYIAGMEVTSGVVVALGGKSTSSESINGQTTSTKTQALVDFAIANTIYQAQGRALGYPKWEIGQKVEVYYSQENPKEFRIKRWDEMYFFTLISLQFLLFLLVLGLINFIVYKIRGRPLS